MSGSGRSAASGFSLGRGVSWPGPKRSKRGPGESGEPPTMKEITIFVDGNHGKMWKFIGSMWKLVKHLVWLHVFLMFFFWGIWLWTANGLFMVDPELNSCVTLNFRHIECQWSLIVMKLRALSLQWFCYAWVKSQVIYHPVHAGHEGQLSSNSP